MYMLGDGAPFKKDKAGNVYARSGERIQLLGATMSIFKEIATDPKWKDTAVAYVSRTEYPEWAIPCLKEIEVVPGKTLHDLGTYFEIYPGGKKTHFRAINKKSGIPFEQVS